jgi:hypothetical protein
LLTLTNLKELADHLGNALKWDSARKEQEIQRAVALLQDRHGVNLEAGS